MQKYKVIFAADAVMEVEIEADSLDEAYDKADERVQSGDFFNEFRDKCEILHPFVDAVIEPYIKY